ncbi:hypothetical protein GLAREA_08657 [Glarea lozoyensis ATCC 20868]|uniref:Uncharacterized protein n=1 Tax=Glarea lozoyensis (strain ATCC 20868 / MF5171) TaxID=1116229 RepID=S3DH61_GLAL2|nr:uncharacterized protein GLAREA_08657 [Glarea lozoyensis ATCC 20868]EPE36494.1 hypothetical protein GLAREA_08657 [Glarea lozoyensis ATCC 20868]
MSSSAGLNHSPLTADAYNSLPHIDNVKELSNRQMHARDKLLHLINSHGLVNVFSIHLIHKHFNVAEGRVMVYETVKGTKHPDFQMCSPRIPSECQNLKGLFFRVSDGGQLAAYEYTTDPVVDVSACGTFFGDISTLMMALGVQDLFALTLKRVEPAANLLEFEISDLTSTILIPDLSGNQDGGNSRPTDWSFISPEVRNDEIDNQILVTKNRQDEELFCIAGTYVAGQDSTHPVAAGTVRCTVTRSGYHHEVITKGNGKIFINGQLIEKESAICEIITHAQRLISPNPGVAVAA